MNLKSTLLFSGVFFAALNVFSQDRLIPSVVSDPEVQLQFVQDAPVNSLRGGQVLACDSLFIENQAGNGYHGNMFDMVVTQEIILETFSVNVDPGTWEFQIYYRTGTYVGNASSSAGWILLGTANVVSTAATDTILTKIPLNLLQTLVPGTYGFYVTGTDPNTPLNYTNGTSVGAVAASNSYFSILEGAGGAYPFDVTNSPRVFNGQAFYCLDVTSVDEQDEFAFTVQPNPANDQVRIVLPNADQRNIEIYNAIGELVMQQQVNQMQCDFDISTLSAGMYFVKVNANGTSSTQRLVVE